MRRQPSPTNLPPLSSRHSLHAISAQLSPVPGCTGADLLQGDGFDLHCFAAATGAKFLALAGPGSADVARFLREMCVGEGRRGAREEEASQRELPLRPP